MSKLPFLCTPGSDGVCDPDSTGAPSIAAASVYAGSNFLFRREMCIHDLRAMAANRCGLPKRPFTFSAHHGHPKLAPPAAQPPASTGSSSPPSFAVPSQFDPIAAGLSADFVLTDYTKLKGCSCKVPQPKLLELLRAVNTTPGAREGNVGMDCSIVPLGPRCIDAETKAPLFLVSTTDYFFPSVEDPYLQGRIGACNVLSDLYAMGIHECDSMLMLLAASTEMDEGDKYTSTMLIMKGYADTCREAGVSVTGGQTVMNPWPLIGGVAMSCVPMARMVPPSGKLAIGDVLVLTKPLGNQIAVNCKQWLRRPSPMFVECLEGTMSAAEIDELYDAAANGMARLNRHAAILMLKHDAHAATDITGFGILGHSVNLAEAQPNVAELTIELRTLPVLAGAVKASVLLQDKYKLFAGLSAETSGGILAAFANASVAEAFCRDLEAAEPGTNAWVVGSVIPRAEKAPAAAIAPDATVLLI